ncbi:GvpL/GvpF family gas vesicle protein [Streptomyces sp. NPDC048002]|uniref:GvpL/GvpF family gas vesicle protein n=1 Tax=unclassified Streptomyces TaxID=2593676 RepID=UPI0033FFBA43
MSAPRYVYAVCRPFQQALQAQLTGVAGQPPRQLTHHGLVALYSVVPERDFAEEPLRAHLADDVWRSETVRAHQGVVDALTAVTTPLPLALATVFRDDSALRTMMEAREEHFRRTLDRLEGRVEWVVRAHAGPGAPGAEDVAGRLHTTLSARAEASRLRDPLLADPSGAHERIVLDAAYLVPRGDCEEFVETVKQSEGMNGGIPGMRIELSGPWAAYSFTGEETP